MSDYKLNSLKFEPVIREGYYTQYPADILVRINLKPQDGKSGPTPDETRKLVDTFLKRADHELENIIKGHPKLAVSWSRSQQCATIQSADTFRVPHAGRLGDKMLQAKEQAAKLTALWQKHMSSEREAALESFFTAGPDHGVNAFAPARDAKQQRISEQEKIYKTFISDLQKQHPNKGQQFLLELNRCSGREGVVDFLERNSSRVNNNKKPKLTRQEKRILHVVHHDPAQAPMRRKEFLVTLAAAALFTGRGGKDYAQLHTIDVAEKDNARQLEDAWKQKFNSYKAVPGIYDREERLQAEDKQLEKDHFWKQLELAADGVLSLITVPVATYATYERVRLPEGSMESLTYHLSKMLDNAQQHHVIKR